MKIIVTEEQIKEIINNVYGNILFEQTKPVSKNQTYATTQDRSLTNERNSVVDKIVNLNAIKDTVTGAGLKIPKGTTFTAHQNGDKKIITPTYTASVDRITNGKNKPSTVYYCNGTNAGKFWNDASKSWYYDKSKVLSGYLSKNLCTKSLADQSYWESKKIDIKGQRTPAQIANFLKTSNTLDDNEPAIELAFSEIKTWERYNSVKKYLGQDPYKFVSQFIDAREKHGNIQSVTTSYSILSKGTTSDQNKELDPSKFTSCPINLTVERPGGPLQYLGLINFMKFFNGPFGTPGSDPNLKKIPDFGWNLNPKTYPYPKYYSQECLNQSKKIMSNFSDIQEAPIEKVDSIDSETTNVVKIPTKIANIAGNDIRYSGLYKKKDDLKIMSDFNQSLSKQKELIPKFCKTPLERKLKKTNINPNDFAQSDPKPKVISMYTLCKDYGGLWVYGAGTSSYTCGCRDNLNPALTTAMKTDKGTFNVNNEIKIQQGSINWGNVNARTVLWGAASLASAFIPVVGPFLAAGIGLGGAADLWANNEKQKAAIAAFFSLLPMVGKIPGVGTIGKGFAEELKAAVINGGSLTEKELETLITIINYDTAISKSAIASLEAQAGNKALSDVTKHILSTAITKTEGLIMGLAGDSSYSGLKKDILKSTLKTTLSGSGLS